MDYGDGPFRQPVSITFGEIIMGGKVIARGLLLMAALSYNIGVAGEVALNEARAGAFVQPTTTAQTIYYQVTPGRFVLTPFSFNLSSHVGLLALESTTAVAVMTGSVKGSGQYVGSSLGGSMISCSAEDEDSDCNAFLRLALTQAIAQEPQ